MAHVEVPRSVESDLLFRLRKKPNGDLIDDDDYTDGLTADQWPIMLFETSGDVDVTALFVKDITADVLPAGWQKHPDPTTGLIREAKGKYRVRVKPDASLTLGAYTWTVTADIGGQPFTEEHDIDLLIAGDVDFADQVIYTTEEDVLDNFELEGIVTSGQVDKARIFADRRVNAKLQACGISIPQQPGLYPALRLAAVAYARADLRRLIAGTAGPGLGIRRLTEGDVTYDFVSPDSQARAFFSEGDEWMDLAIDAILGRAYVHVSKMGSRTDGRGQF